MFQFSSSNCEKLCESTLIYIPQEREFHNEENGNSLILIQLGSLDRKFIKYEGKVKVCFIFLVIFRYIYYSI